MEELGENNMERFEWTEEGGQRGPTDRRKVEGIQQVGHVGTNLVSLLGDTTSLLECAY